MSLQPNSPTTSIADPVRSPSLPPAPMAVMKIANAPEDLVRAVLIALCQDHYTERKAMSHFSKLEKLRSDQRRREGVNVGASVNEKSNDADRAEAKRPNKRRAISEIAICLNCNEPFSEDDNRPDACRHHPGEMEVNDEAWEDCDDWPSECDPRNTEEDKEDNPEGYIWDCCEQSGDSAGCALGSHEGLYKKPHGAPIVILD
ncbi:hypothetical protein F5Y09DRAFT_331017 [Xylaria sp. FL1042]|nr:hypothetical protein F5Y09DRAFT_331017 [Xylaria sp. FL1042]